MIYRSLYVIYNFYFYCYCYCCYLYIGNKPAFMTDERNSLSLYRVHPADGTLSNVEVMSSGDPRAVYQEGKLFQGGNAQKLHHLLQVSSGDKVLYVGDHMYSDVVRTKRSQGWRTCLIVPELGTMQ